MHSGYVQIRLGERSMLYEANWKEVPPDQNDELYNELVRLRGARPHSNRGQPCFVVEGQVDSSREEHELLGDILGIFNRHNFTMTEKFGS